MAEDKKKKQNEAALEEVVTWMGSFEGVPPRETLIVSGYVKALSQDIENKVKKDA